MPILLVLTRFAVDFSFSYTSGTNQLCGMGNYLDMHMSVFLCEKYMTFCSQFASFLAHIAVLQSFGSEQLQLAVAMFLCLIDFHFF